MNSYKSTSRAQCGRTAKHQLHILVKSVLLLLGFCLAVTAADVLCGHRPGIRCKNDTSNSLPCEESRVFPDYGVCKRACTTTPGYYFSSCEVGLTEDTCSQDTLVMSVIQERRACTAPMVCGPGEWVPLYPRTETNTFSWEPYYTGCGG